MRALPAILPAIAVFAFAAPSGAETAPIGLSEVRSRAIANDSVPAEGDGLGRAVAAGDFNGDGADDLAIGAPFDSTPESFDVGSVRVRYGLPGHGLDGGAPPSVLQQPPSESFDEEYFGDALAAGDFDGDGFDDLAVGVPNDGPLFHGGVWVYFGSSSGLQVGEYQFLEESDAGEPQHRCAFAHFGSALAAGNFDGDAYADLAIGAYWGCERIDDTTFVHGGSVFVAHGKASGLLPFLGYRMSQNSFGFDPSEEDDRFGAALASGNFDADSYDDLAIGIPGESGHGAIQIVIGSQFGLIFATNATWYPAALGENAEAGDQLGYALAAGDFDGDGHDDLAIGSPGEDFDPGTPIPNVGKVAIAYGGPPPAWFDLARTDRLWQSDVFGDPIHDGELDAFGYALAAGDFDGDALADLAVGHPFDDWSASSHGNVTILMGDSAGLAASTRHRLLATGWEGIAGAPDEINQNSGSALATGDFDGNGFADLAIGAPYADGALEFDAGTVTVLYGALYADGFEGGTLGRWSGWAPLP